MTYWIVGYAIVAVLFMLKAATYTAQIGDQAQFLYYEDLWQMRWERMMMLAMPYLVIFLLMLALPPLYFMDVATAWAMDYLSGLRDIGYYLVIAAAWVVWGIAWLVIVLCAIAVAGTIYYHWKVEERHVRQYEALKRNRDITQIAYPRNKWGKWVRVRRWNV